MKLSTLHAALPLALAALALGGWTRPKGPSSAAPQSGGARLDYVLFHVNGKPRLVKAGEELVVVKGDTVEVKDAERVARGPIAEVNVVGFSTTTHPNKKAPGDERGVPFKTTELGVRHSEGAKGEVFAVTAGDKKRLAGVVYLRVTPPVLRYAEISVNGERRVLRDGEPLTAKASDMVKVETVKTNLEGTSDVIFQIVPQKGDLYEIRFQRGGETFARIPLTLERG
jgi:hypothetical protein